MNHENGTNPDFCVCCGEPVPEGRMVCRCCEMNMEKVGQLAQREGTKSVNRRFPLSKGARK